MNLIICYTPLQVLIAEKIIEKHPENQFYGVMIYVAKNTKFAYYTERLKAKCADFFEMHQHTDRINLLKEIISLKSHFKGKKFDRVFVASINDLQIQFLLSAIQFDELYTFDDGTANIVNSSVYYQKEPDTFVRKWINRLFRNKYSTQKLKSISKGHYTIYPNFTNIIKNTLPVHLFEGNKQVEHNNEKVVSLLLGQPVYLESQKNIDLAKKVIEQFNIDYYLPHPREQYIVPKVTYIETPLIFEDYIAQKFKDKNCRIYTYFSSAVLNVKSENIEIVALRVDTDNPAFIECYELLNRMGIKIIDIRE